jgi:hypothetical protein
MDAMKVVRNVVNAKGNAIENDPTWGSRRMDEEMQRMMVKATGNTRDFGSLFLYHTWVTFCDCQRWSVMSRNYENSITIGMKMLTARAS